MSTETPRSETRQIGAAWTGAIVLAVALSACATPSNQVDLTIALSAEVDVRAIAALDVSFAGAVSSSQTYGLAPGITFPQRLIIQPVPDRGTLHTAAVARDSSGAVIAMAGADLVLRSGSVPVELTLEPVGATPDGGVDASAADSGALDLAPPDLSGPQLLTVVVSGAGTGSVSSSPAGIACGAACTTSASFAAGSTVQITVTNATGRRIHWGGDCFSTSSTCSVTMNAARRVHVTLDGNNYVFVTSQTYATTAFGAAQGGLSHGDQLCQALAVGAGLPGTYVAWLSSSTIDAKARLLVPGGGAARGWIRLDGLPFADTLADLTSSRILFPPAFVESGAPALASVVITGTTTAGTAGPNAHTCVDWSTTSSSTFGYGVATLSSDAWTDSTLLRLCDNVGSLYCFGVDLTTPVKLDPEPAQVRHAFVSASTFAPSASGLAGADAVCVGDAMSHGLTNPTGFRALLGTQASAAIARFDLTGAPWYRTDGLPWLDPASGLATLSFASVLVGPDGAAHSQQMWTGAPSPNVPATANCMEWTSSSPNATAYIGISDAGAAGFYGIGMAGCPSAFHLYCLEN